MTWRQHLQRSAQLSSAQLSSAQVAVLLRALTTNTGNDVASLVKYGALSADIVAEEAIDLVSV